MQKIADGHCDTLYKHANNDTDCTITSKRLCEANYALQIFAIWDKWEEVNPYDSIEFQSMLYAKKILPVLKKKEIQGILSLEGGDIFNDGINRIEDILNFGIQAMSLTWNNDNAIGGGSNGNIGLSPYGKEVVEALEENGIIIDVSHLSEESFYDLIKIIKRPIFASHSNCYSLMPHKRNLTDEQIKIIASTGGTIGICFYKYFLSKSKYVYLSDVVKHIDYICQMLGNCDHVAFGSDFDGISEFVIGLETPIDIQKIFKLLIDLGYTNTDIDKIAYRNLRGFVIK